MIAAEVGNSGWHRCPERETMQKTASLPTAALLFAAVMWGFTWLPLKFINGLGVDGASLTLIAFGAASLLVLPSMLLQSRRWRGHTVAIAVMFLFGGFANLAFTVALIYGEIIRVMILFYLAPVWGVLGGRVFLGERIDRKRWAGMALAVAGALLVLGGPAVFDSPPSLYDLLAVASGFAFAMNNVACRAVQTVPVASKLGAMFVGSTALAAAFLWFTVGAWPVVSADGWVWSVAYGLVWIVVATLATQWAVTHMEAGRAAIILILELVVAVASGALLAGEVLTLAELAGGSLILAATLLEARRHVVPDVSHAVS
jgi:drug/metabolite transporter (DMT)-like permease